MKSIKPKVICTPRNFVTQQASSQLLHKKHKEGTKDTKTQQSFVTQNTLRETLRNFVKLRATTQKPVVTQKTQRRHKRHKNTAILRETLRIFVQQQEKLPKAIY